MKIGAKEVSAKEAVTSKRQWWLTKTFPNVIPSLSRLLRDKRSDRLEPKLCSLPQKNCRCKVNSSHWECSWESTCVLLVFCSEWETKEKLPFAQNWEAGERTAAVKVYLWTEGRGKYQCVGCPVTAASSTEGQFPPVLQLLWKRLLGQSSSWPHRALVGSSWGGNTWVHPGALFLSQRHTCTTPRSVQLA